MAEFQSVQSLIQTLPTATSGTGTPGELGKDEFLKLMVIQLNYQDPMNPLDATQFSSQLAQFTTVEQLSNLNDLTEQGMQSDMLLAQSINNTLSSTIIGKDVKAQTDSIRLQDGVAGEISYELTSEVKEVTLNIRDDSGKLIRSITVKNPGIGEGEIAWNGKNSEGVRVADGEYQVELEVKEPGGNIHSIPAFFIGRIDAVRYSAAGAALIVNGQQINFGDVLEIRDTTGGGSPLSWMNLGL